MPAPEVDAWLRSKRYTTIGSLALRPRPHPLLPETPLSVSRGQAEAFYVQSRDGQYCLIKKFHRGMAPDPGYLSAIASILPRHDAFAAGSQRKVIQSTDVLGTGKTSSLATWLDGTVLMPKVNGVDWATVADRQREGDDVLTDEGWARLCKSLAQAVDALEQAGCTHRDLSSGNVYIDPLYWTVSLIDWDSVRHQSLTMPANTTCGTPGYIAPFVWNNDQVDPLATWAERGDRFAMALMSAEFLTADEDSALTGDGGMFDQQELRNRSGKSIDNIRRALARRSLDALALFNRALRANAYLDCPAPDEWDAVANTLLGIAPVPAVPVSTDWFEESTFLTNTVERPVAPPMVVSPEQWASNTRHVQPAIYVKDFTEWGTAPTNQPPGGGAPAPAVVPFDHWASNQTTDAAPSPWPKTPHDDPKT